MRTVKTASGATAVQVVAKDHGVRRIVEHLGSAHDEAELAALMRLGRQRLLAGQQVLDLGPILGLLGVFRTLLVLGFRLPWLGPGILARPR